MPRRKPVQPEPLQVILSEDGSLIVEIRDDKCRVIGQGLHNKDEYEKKRDRALELVVELFLSMEKQKRNIAASMLKSDKALSEELQRQGYEGDERNLRRLAKEVRMHMRIFLGLN